MKRYDKLSLLVFIALLDGKGFQCQNLFSYFELWHLLSLSSRTDFNLKSKCQDILLDNKPDEFVQYRKCCNLIDIPNTPK